MPKPHHQGNIWWGCSTLPFFQDCSTIITTLKISIKKQHNAQSRHARIHSSIHVSWPERLAPCIWKVLMASSTASAKLMSKSSMFSFTAPSKPSCEITTFGFITGAMEHASSDLPSDPFWIAPTQPSIGTCIPVCYAKPLLSSFKFASSHHQLYLPAKASRKGRWYLWEM